jgi:hypothetical protein
MMDYWLNFLYELLSLLMAGARLIMVPNRPVKHINHEENIGHCKPLFNPNPDS